MGELSKLKLENYHHYAGTSCIIAQYKTNEDNFGGYKDLYLFYAKNYKEAKLVTRDIERVSGEFDSDDELELPSDGYRYTKRVNGDVRAMDDGKHLWVEFYDTEINKTYYLEVDLETYEAEILDDINPIILMLF